MEVKRPTSVENKKANKRLLNSLANLFKIFRAFNTPFFILCVPGTLCTLKDYNSQLLSNERYNNFKQKVLLSVFVYYSQGVSENPLFTVNLAVISISFIRPTFSPFKNTFAHLTVGFLNKKYF